MSDDTGIYWSVFQFNQHFPSVYQIKISVVFLFSIWLVSINPWSLSVELSSEAPKVIDLFMWFYFTNVNKCLFHLWSKVRNGCPEWNLSILDRSAPWIVMRSVTMSLNVLQSASTTTAVCTHGGKRSGNEDFVWFVLYFVFFKSVVQENWLRYMCSSVTLICS